MPVVRLAPKSDNAQWPLWVKCSRSSVLRSPSHDSEWLACLELPHNASPIAPRWSKLFERMRDPRPVYWDRKAYQSASWRLWAKQNAIGSSPGVLCRRAAGAAKKNPTPHRNDLIGHIAG